MDAFDVVIPTSKNVEETHFSICYTLRSILAQSVQPQNIYVVENVPNTGVKEQVNHYFGDLVKVIDGLRKPVNIAYARNLGVQRTKSDIIIFMDDDVVIGRNDFFQKNNRFFVIGW